MGLIYYENPAISQSKLKLLLSNPRLFYTVEEPEMYFEEKKHFIIGSAVDCLLTQPPVAFTSQYHISNVQNKPSDTIKSIVNQVFDAVRVAQETRSNYIGSITDYSTLILEACNEHEYQSRWNDQTRINKVCEAWEYWEDLKQALGKQVLSQEENDLISQIVMSIRTNPTTSKYFETSKDIEILDQLAIYFPYNNVDCKALLDRVIVDHKNKTIQPIDFKTMGDQTIYFPKSLRQRRYDIQAAFYNEALKYFIERDDKTLQDYKILPFKFIVESTVDPGTPLVFTCSENLLNIGEYGRLPYKLCDKPYAATEYTTYMKFDEIKGFHQLIEDYKWYLENEFEIKREIVESQGEFQLDWNGIIN